MSRQSYRRLSSVNVPSLKHNLHQLDITNYFLPVLGFMIALFRRPIGELVTNSTIVLPVQLTSAMTVSFVNTPMMKYLT